MFFPGDLLWAVYHKLCEPRTYAFFKIRLIDLGHCAGVFVTPLGIGNQLKHSTSVLLEHNAMRRHGLSFTFTP